MRRCSIIPVGILLFVFVTGCSSKQDQSYLFKINNYTVSPQEFEYRYMFNPYLAKINDPHTAKKILLTSLIAEKIIYLEAQKNGFVQNDLSKRASHHLKEAMIEELRRDSVEKEIAVRPAELKAEFLESLKERKVQIAAFKSGEDARKIRNSVSSGDSFEQRVRKFMKNKGRAEGGISGYVLKWGGAYSAIREQIKNLSPGQISKPIFADNRYYLVKVLNIYQTEQPTEKEFESRRSALEDYLRREKIKSRYTQFYRTSMQSYLGVLDLKRLNYLLGAVLGQSDFFRAPPQNIERKKELADQIYLAAKDIRDEMKNAKVVNFPDGSSWTFNALLEELKYGPYAFNYQNPAAFKASLIKNAQLAMEYEALYRMAKKLGYDKRPQVVDEAKMWKSYLQASAYRFKLLSRISAGGGEVKSNPGTLSPLQELRLEAMDSLLSTAVSSYGIKINKNTYDHINVPKADMLVLKKHFEHRLIAPLLQPYSGLPRWQHKADSLLRGCGII